MAAVSESDLDAADSREIAALESEIAPLKSASAAKRAEIESCGLHSAGAEKLLDEMSDINRRVHKLQMDLVRLQAKKSRRATELMRRTMVEQGVVLRPGEGLLSGFARAQNVAIAASMHRALDRLAEPPEATASGIACSGTERPETHGGAALK